MCCVLIRIGFLWKLDLWSRSSIIRTGLRISLQEPFTLYPTGTTKKKETNTRMSNPDVEDNRGKRAFATLGEYLERDGWHPQRLGDDTIYRTGFLGENGQMVCYAQVLSDLEQFLFYVLAPVKAPEDRRPAVAEFITRANFGLRIGNFEMDFADGEVRYKSSLDFEDAMLTPELIKGAIYPAVRTMDRYLPGLMRVIYGGQSALEAILEIEQ